MKNKNALKLKIQGFIKNTQMIYKHCYMKKISVTK